jgi:DNA-binding HxlR family transcriptional regulator
MFERPELLLFSGTWQQARRMLDDQQEMLRGLFDAAKAQADAKLPFRLEQTSFNLMTMTKEQSEALAGFFRQDGITTVARDAYATALVLFLDMMFKELWTYFSLLRNAKKSFNTGIAGVELRTIVAHTANNVRHFQEWRFTLPPKILARALENAMTIAKVTRKTEPTADTLAEMANNWSWLVLVSISGRSFDGLMTIVNQYMDEMLDNAGLDANNLPVLVP